MEVLIEVSGSEKYEKGKKRKKKKWYISRFQNDKDSNAGGGGSVSLWT